MQESESGEKGVKFELESGVIYRKFPNNNGWLKSDIFELFVIELL